MSSFYREGAEDPLEDAGTVQQQLDQVSAQPIVVCIHVEYCYFSEQSVLLWLTSDIW